MKVRAIQFPLIYVNDNLKTFLKVGTEHQNLLINREKKTRAVKSGIGIGVLY